MKRTFTALFHRSAQSALKLHYYPDRPGITMDSLSLLHRSNESNTPSKHRHSDKYSENIFHCQISGTQTRLGKQGNLCTQGYKSLSLIGFEPGTSPPRVLSPNY